jgi:CheY-like chemotaxis protein
MAEAPAVHVLIVEDSLDDAELMAHRLHDAGLRCDIRRVESRLLFRRALAEQEPDVILAD